VYKAIATDPKFADLLAQVLWKHNAVVEAVLLRFVFAICSFYIGKLK
jgi:hypothetical protein